MTSLPKEQSKTRLGLVIDLDICVGCHACAVNCKEWNSSGYHAPMTDKDPYGHDPLGVWFNRIHTFEETSEAGQRITDDTNGNYNPETEQLGSSSPLCRSQMPQGRSGFLEAHIQTARTE